MPDTCYAAVSQVHVGIHCLLKMVETVIDFVCMCGITKVLLHLGRLSREGSYSNAVSSSFFSELQLP